MRAMLINGAGNAFLLADARGGPAPRPSAAAVRALAEQYGFDQLLVLEAAGEGHAAFMRVFNADGGESGACGNGARAAALWLMDESGAAALTLDSAAGPLAAERTGALRARVDLGPARTGWRDIPLARAMDTVALDYAVEAAGVRLSAPGAASMGNPHAVFFVDDVEALPVREIGPVVEHDPLFPERVNAGFAQVLAPDRIRLKVWERGTGLTRACGTGAAAALVCAARRGLTGREAVIVADGGELRAVWREDGHVTLDGPVEITGETEIAL
ncbi:MAG: diaminopimelate epimerase [Maricaulaceae bacterium]|nr:diaminopimelate epimerase [Maricaulaceae bacterium]